MASPLHIVFTGGGSGGHLFPGLAVAEQLAVQIPSVRITFVGSGKEFERRHVAAGGFEYLALPSRPLPKRPREALSFVVDNLAGYLAARRFLDEHEVAAVVGLGGYASVPMARAAARRRVPLVLLEQNAVPGRATRWLARRAQMICLALPQARAQLSSRSAVRVTGNPLRRGFAERFPPDWPASARIVQRRTLFILGGSSGAHTLNETVPRALYKIRARLGGWRILHQAGQQDLEATRQLYRKLDLPGRVVGFIDDVPDALAGAGLAICRAGGTTLAELAAAGLPAVLLPYPHAAADHQRRNAEVFTHGGAALLLDQRQLAGRLDHHLAAVLADLLPDAAGRQRMSLAMLRFARLRAAAEVAETILQTARNTAAGPADVAA